MKRTGNLYDSIADMDNLHVAFWKAARGKSSRPDVQEFRASLQQNLSALQRDLQREQISLGNYRYFTVHDPKERTVCAASFRERVLHHAMMNVCHESFEKYQVFDSYASRLGKGTYAALKRAREFTQPNEYFLKMDVRKYFDSICHTTLKTFLQKRFKDKQLLRLLGQIIDSYETRSNLGLPIGNLTSQYFANHFLAVLDHQIKEVWRVQRYVRYMDDMVIWSASKQWLQMILRKTKEFLYHQLKLELKHDFVNHTERGIPFLGYVVFPEQMVLQKNSKKRFQRKLKTAWSRFEQGIWNESEFVEHVRPLIAYTDHADDAITFRLRQKNFKIQRLCTPLSVTSVPLCFKT